MDGRSHCSDYSICEYYEIRLAVCACQQHEVSRDYNKLLKCVINVGWMFFGFQRINNEYTGIKSATTSPPPTVASLSPLSRGSPSGGRTLRCPWHGTHTLPYRMVWWSGGPIRKMDVPSLWVTLPAFVSRCGYNFFPP